MILITLCTVQAVKARKIPENFNEAKQDDDGYDYNNDDDHDDHDHNDDEEVLILTLQYSPPVRKQMNKNATKSTFPCHIDENLAIHCTIIQYF